MTAPRQPRPTISVILTLSASLRRPNPAVLRRPAAALAALVALAGGLGATGCGGTLYAVQASAASSKVNEAKAVGAEKMAPYEFYLAEEHMKKASEEASQANYGDAVELAEKAEEAADKAIKLSRDAHKGKGRLPMNTHHRPGRLALLGLAALVGAALNTGCGAESEIRGRIDGYRKIAKQAKDNGAVTCAPRELAMAESHLGFAQIELEQGFVLRARQHLDLGVVNAQAAYDLSPPAYCAERGLVQPKPGDRDGDGYLDPEDQCPDEPETWNNFKDEDGCPDDPDTDGDGLTDSKDACPLDPEDKDSYLDEDGCPEPDNDLDGILDGKDKCINDPEDPDGFEDEDGCPELDNDQDTVVDLEDQCPNEKGDPNNAEKKGCPKNSLVIVTDKEVKILQQIHFEFDKDKIRPESFNIIEAVADVMRQYPDMMLEIQGHTDNKGSAVYNKSLSDRRAKAVMKHLVTKLKIDAKRLSAKGYGMEIPLVANDTALNRALNRRVQFIRTDKPAPKLAVRREVRPGLPPVQRALSRAGRCA
jgi:OmpA-OmpF porin, OOP family